MDDETFRSIDVRENVHIDGSPRSSELKLQFGQLQKTISTPITSLCDSFSSAVLSTPVQNICNTNERGIADSTPKNSKTPVPSLLSQLGCQTPKSIVVTDFLPLFKTPLVSEKVNTTPRRNPRRSCSARYSNFADEFKDLHDDDVSQKNTSTLIDNILQSDSLLGVSSNDIKEVDECSEVLDLCIKDSVIASKCGEQRTAFLPQDDRESIKNCEGKIISDDLQKTANVECSTPSVISNVSKFKAITEPRPRTRKSDVSASSIHKLRLSAKRPSFKKKNVIEEYDPDNDIFAHGVMPTHFNDDSLKNEIGKFLSSSDVPVTGLQRSQSCGTLNDLSAPMEVIPSRCSTPKRKHTKQASQNPPKDSSIKRTVSAPNLLESMSEEVKPSKEVPKEGAVRAFLRARDIIMNIQKRRNMNNLRPQEVNTSFNKVKTSQNSNNTARKTLSNSFDGNEDNNISLETNDSVSDSDNNSFEFSLPPTQPFESLILREVTAYVEVISNNENISAGVRTELMKLGATVVSNFNRNVPVTHVVFNDGLISTYKKAKKRNIPLVSVLWIEECRKAGVKVHESLYPPYQIERYESPSVVKQLQKRRILHFPSDERPRPSPRRKKGVSSVASSAVEQTEKKFPMRKRSSVPKWVNQVAGDNGMMRMLVNMTGIGPGEFKDIVKRPPTPDSEVESNVDSPLAVRLLRKLAKNLDVPTGESCEEEQRNKSAIDGNVSQADQKKEKKETGENSPPKNQNNNPSKDILPVKTPENSSSAHDPSCLSNVTQRKKTSKRKLLSTIDETVSVSDDNSVCGDVANPYNSTPKRLSGDNKEEKRKKASNSSDIPPENVNMKGTNPKNAEQQNINNDYPVRRSRRSSMYFVNNNKRKSSPVTQKPSIVCTLLHSVDVEIIESIVDKLGTYVVEKNLTLNTTHIVAGDARRTMKLLKGMVRGCWIVSREWVLKSLEAEKWLDEEEFEMTTFSPSVQKYRLEKLSFGATFKPDIFRDCGRIFVSSKSSAPRGDVVELILLCGGRVCSRVGNAEIIVGKKHPGITSVTALWVLDSITAYSLQPFDSYLCT